MAVLEREHSQGATLRGVDALLFSPKSVPTQVSPQRGPTSRKTICGIYASSLHFYLMLRITWYIFQWLVLMWWTWGKISTVQLQCTHLNFLFKFQFDTIYYFQWLFVATMTCRNWARMTHYVSWWDVLGLYSAIRHLQEEKHLLFIAGVSKSHIPEWYSLL